MSEMQPVLLEVRAVLFDLDGVLIDSGARVEEAWSVWAAEHGVDVAAVLDIAHGRRTVEVISAVAPHLHAEVEAEALELQESEATSGLVEIEGASKLLADLPAGRWAVVTSGTRGLATARLIAKGLPVPDVLVTAEDVAAGKPDPEGYLAAARRLGAAAPDCVVFEDAPPGIAAARTGSMTTVGVVTTHPIVDLLDADYLISSLAAVRVLPPATENGIRMELSVIR